MINHWGSEKSNGGSPAHPFLAFQIKVLDCTGGSNGDISCLDADRHVEQRRFKGGGALRSIESEGTVSSCS